MEPAAGRLAHRRRPGLDAGPGAPGRRSAPGRSRLINDDMPGRIYIVSGTRSSTWHKSFNALPARPSTSKTSATSARRTPLLGALNSSGDHRRRTHRPGRPLQPERLYVLARPRLAASILITDPDSQPASSVLLCRWIFRLPGRGQYRRKWSYLPIIGPRQLRRSDFPRIPDARPNVIRRVISHRRQLLDLGEGGFEVFYNAGSSPGWRRRQARRSILLNAWRVCPSHRDAIAHVELHR